MLTLHVQLIHPKAVLPVHIHDGDAGYDLASCEASIVPADHEVLIPTGFRLQFPEGFYARIVGRSSSRLRGLRISESIIDSGYRGEIFVCASAWQGTVEIPQGERIAQLLLHPLVIASIEVSESISFQSPDGSWLQWFWIDGRMTSI